jgi:hypothetical protein
MSKYCVIDIETSIKESFLRKANPFDPENTIVAIGLKKKGEDARTYYKEEDWNSVLREIFSDVSVMIAFNAKFECLYFWKYPAFQDWLKSGGKIYCPQSGHYILTGQRHKYPALRDIAVNNYGCEERPKHMEDYWNKGIDTADIPKELVLEDVTNDVLDTEKVMLKQISNLKENKMYTLAMEMSESILATTEMEHNGIYINQEIFHNNKKKLESRISEIKDQLDLLSRRYWK